MITLRDLRHRIKKDYDKNVYLESRFASDDYVSVDSSPLTISPAERTAAEGYSKLMFRHLRP